MTGIHHLGSKRCLTLRCSLQFELGSTGIKGEAGISHNHVLPFVRATSPS